MTLRRRLYLTLEPNEKGGTLERIFEFSLITIIVLNILAIVLDTEVSLRKEYNFFFNAFEFFSLLFFSLEYIARVYSIVENPRFQHPVKGRLNYMRSPMAIVDLLAVIPFYVKFTSVSFT